nr:hypothetical protein [uncultured Psychrobacter sp.]
MISEKTIVKSFTVLLISLIMASCQEEDNYNVDRQTLCVDEDTSVANDISDDGIVWSLSKYDLTNIMALVHKQESYREIYVMHSITTCDLE